ncbi:MAG: hypothetical protein ACTMIR_07055 [Cellulomonadaceae bacterium]
MTVLYDALLVLHLVGWAIVLGGWLATLRSPGIYVGVFHGALTALVTGLAMVGLASAGLAGREPNHVKIAVKLVLALVVTVLAYLATTKSKRGEKVPAGEKSTIGALTLVNVVVAVFW